MSSGPASWLLTKNSIMYLEKQTEYSIILQNHNSSEKNQYIAWTDAVKDMKRGFDGQGQYTPL